MIICFEWKETRRYYSDLYDNRVKVIVAVLGNQDFKDSKQNEIKKVCSLLKLNRKKIYS